MALASMSEIFERMARNGQEFWEVVLADDMDERQVSREASMAKMLTTWQAMQDAAKNQGGAFTGFMGMNMANMNSGLNANTLFQMGAQQQAQQTPAQPAANSWKCACGATVTGKFCPECGSPAPAPAPAKWFCPNCGSENGGKFCSNCGTPRP